MMMKEDVVQRIGKRNAADPELAAHPPEIPKVGHDDWSGFVYYRKATFLIVAPHLKNSNQLERRHKEHIQYLTALDTCFQLKVSLCSHL